VLTKAADAWSESIRGADQRFKFVVYKNIPGFIRSEQAATATIELDHSAFNNRAFELFDRRDAVARVVPWNAGEADGVREKRLALASI